MQERSFSIVVIGIFSVALVHAPARAQRGAVDDPGVTLQQQPAPPVTSPAGTVALPSDGVSCPGGQEVSVDTAGHCCWPEQVWSSTQQRCLGVPACGAGLEVEGESCVIPSGCPSGQRITADTAGKCCWPGQAWSHRRQRCVGVPRCGERQVASRESCVPAPAIGQGGLKSEGSVPLSLVSFEAASRGNSYTVTIGGKSCTTPCSLDLPPGPAHLRASGDGKIDQEVVVPSGRSAMKLQHDWTPTLYAGVVMVVTGTALLLANIGVATCRTNGCAEAVVALGMGIGPAMHIAGLITLSVALARLNAANRFRPWNGEATSSRQPVPAAPLRLVDLSLGPLPGGAMAGAQFAF